MQYVNHKEKITMSEQTLITMPLFIQLAKSIKGKKYHINLNNYRNWHMQVSNNLKIRYKEMSVAALEDAPTIKANKIAIEYTLYRGDKRDFDLMNILSVHDKFFCDALVWLGCVPDDNINHIDSFTFKYGGYEKNKGRVEIKITKIE